eukprot:COSAG01_NODE_1968_length_8769_cov_5.768166_12_plen_168_part_00
MTDWETTQTNRVEVGRGRVATVAHRVDANPAPSGLLSRWPLRASVSVTGTDRRCTGNSQTKVNRLGQVTSTDRRCTGNSQTKANRLGQVTSTDRRCTGNSQTKANRLGQPAHLPSGERAAARRGAAIRLHRFHVHPHLERASRRAGGRAQPQRLQALHAALRASISH